jgi:predicted nucleic acid-binding protein
MGTSLFIEYESALRRPSLFSRCVLDTAERDDLLDAFLSVCQWTNVYYTWRPNLPDDDDNHILELAIAGAAHCIVTKNTKDFLHTDLAFPNVAILKPEELLRRS